MKYSKITHEINETGLSITPGFASEAFTHALREDLFQLRKQQQFKEAGIGKGKSNQVRSTVRKNEQCWLDRLEPTLTQTHLWQEIDQLQLAINRELFLGLNQFEGHYTWYGEGGFYQRHLDSFTSDSSRIISIILYLNQNWSPDHGGELRIYQGKTTVDIPPRSGTLVCFLSRELEHEVLPNHAERLSFTGWFKNSQRL